MRRSTTLFALTIVLTATLSLPHTTYCHKEWVHKYLVKESYRYLEFHIGPIPELRDRIGMNFYGRADDDNPWATGLIGVAAWREDLEDPVYGSGNWFQGWTPSSTHIWRSDGGDNVTTPIPLSPNAPNAYTKAKDYLFSGHRIFRYGPSYDPDMDRSQVTFIPTVR